MQFRTYIYQRFWIPALLFLFGVFALYQMRFGYSSFSIDKVNEVTTVKSQDTRNCTSYDDFIQAQLQTAQRNWERGQQKQIGKKPPLGESKIWNYFAPTFSCPLTSERIGRLGDGGKWVCGFSQLLSNKSNCLIYSFGVGYEQSFEQEIMERSNCTIRMFDPTISDPPAFISNYPNRAIWYKIGIGHIDSPNSDYLTLKSIMKKYGDENKILDVLKMDVEGAEWKTMENVPEDFPENLPFAQFLFEIHMSKSSDQSFVEFTKWWQNLEKHGLRPFSIELNYAAAQMFKFSEFAMLNINVHPFRIQNNSR